MRAGMLIVYFYYSGIAFHIDLGSFTISAELSYQAVEKRLSVYYINRGLSYF